MPGAITQLSYYGPQDIVFTGAPEITFYSLEHKRYTNFAIEDVEVQPNGAVDFNRKLTFAIPRNGDLISGLELEVNLPTLTGTGTQAWVNNIGEVLLKDYSILIGGQTIDKRYGQFMHIWQELTRQPGHEYTYNIKTGNTTALTTEAGTVNGAKLSIPLDFWFCKFIGNSLPMIALQYHDVKLEVNLRPFSECYKSSSGTVTTPTLGNVSLWVKYVYLDDDERKQFAAAPHEHLITQLQFTGENSWAQPSVSERLNFNQPCSEILWVAQLDANVQSVASAGALANRWMDFTDNGVGAKPYEGADPMSDAKIQLNGQDRFATRTADYFNLSQPLSHHTRGPATGIYCYNFGWKPEEYQPSGSCNFSRIDSAILKLTMTSSASLLLYVYAINYNILRIMGGMASPSYSS